MSESGRLPIVDGGGRGFTLIELMIVVAVVAILAAIALPSYQEMLRKGNRADAKAVLMETAQFMERYFTTHNTYVGATLPGDRSPKGAIDSDRRYTISFVTGQPQATTFVVQAIPFAGSTQEQDKCGTLSLDNTGLQKAVKGGSVVAGCW